MLSLQDYNTRLVVLTTTLLGVASGIVGSFLLLRKRSLMGDTLSHATLPGIGLAFLVAVHLGGTGKSLPVLLLGAVVTGALGAGTVLLVRGLTRIKDDAAMGLVLSVFFGAGVALLGVIQRMPEGSAAGLESFIYGKTASMVQSDFYLLALVALMSVVVALVFYKELRLLCFDEGFARGQGWPTKLLDGVLLALVTAVTVAGLQAVGLILIIALLITPASAARFWTDRLHWVIALAALIGGLSGWLGASVSALYPGLPAGAIIVLMAAAGFLVSMLFGTGRGVLIRLSRQRQLRRKIGRQHLLRAIFEVTEEQCRGGDLRPVEVSWAYLRKRRSWSDSRLRHLARRAWSDALLEKPGPTGVKPTEGGLREAAKVTRNHRLWEIFLIEHADVAPSQVDRDADAVEHVIGVEMVRRLEEKLPAHLTGSAVPHSPHPL